MPFASSSIKLSFSVSLMIPLTRSAVTGNIAEARTRRKPGVWSLQSLESRLGTPDSGPQTRHAVKDASADWRVLPGGESRGGRYTDARNFPLAQKESLTVSELQIPRHPEERSLQRDFFDQQVSKLKKDKTLRHGEASSDEGC